jgi:hypothetical protein
MSNRPIGFQNNDQNGDERVSKGNNRKTSGRNGVEKFIATNTQNYLQG